LCWRHPAVIREQLPAYSWQGIVQFMGMQAPYWLLRTWNQLRIVHVRDLGAGGSMERLQYSLRQMLLAMTVVAVSLAIGRGVFALAGTAPANSNIAITLLAFFAILVCFNLLLAWPLLWALLAPTGVQWKIAASALLAGLVIVSALPLTTTVLGGEGPSIFWLVFVPQPAFLLTHLLAMRLAGYRLVRLT
jgi:hypothetical protein